jgi:hypothetical protein
LSQLISDGCTRQSSLGRLLGKISEWYARFCSGDYAGALQSIEQQIAKEPDEAVHHYNRGTVLRKLHRDDEALVSYLHAKQLSLARGEEDIADAVSHFVWPSRNDPNQFVFVADAWWENLRRSEIVPQEFCQHPDCIRPRLVLSIYCPWHHYEMIQGKCCPYGDND